MPGVYLRPKNRPKKLPSVALVKYPYIAITINGQLPGDISFGPIAADREFRKDLRQFLRLLQTSVANELRKTVMYWKDPVHWERDAGTLSLRGSSMVFFVYATPSAATDHWRWLDEGTNERWAYMSRNWQSKTTPGKYTSGPGYGRVLFKGRAAFAKAARYNSETMSSTMGGIPPQPGIEPRRWTEMLEIPLSSAMVNGVMEMLKLEFDLRNPYSKIYADRDAYRGRWIKSGKELDRLWGFNDARY